MLPLNALLPLQGHTQTDPAERVGDMSAAESADPSNSWSYQKIPTRIAQMHPELIDTLPSPQLDKANTPGVPSYSSLNSLWLSTGRDS